MLEMGYGFSMVSLVEAMVFNLDHQKLEASRQQRGFFLPSTSTNFFCLHEGPLTKTIDLVFYDNYDHKFRCSHGFLRVVDIDSGKHRWV